MIQLYEIINYLMNVMDKVITFVQKYINTPFPLFSFPPSIEMRCNGKITLQVQCVNFSTIK